MSNVLEWPAAENQVMTVLPSERQSKQIDRLKGPEMSKRLKFEITRHNEATNRYIDTQDVEDNEPRDTNIHQLFNSTTALTNVEDARPPVTVIIFEAGAGKSVSTAQLLATQMQGIKTVYLGDSIRQMQEFVETARKFKLKVVLLRGRDQVNEDGEDMCSRRELTTAMAKKGVNVTESACLRRVKDPKTGEDKEHKCPFYDMCHYNKQFAEAEDADVVVTSHQFLKLESRGLKNIQNVVIDENAISTLTGEASVNLDAFMAFRVPGEKGLTHKPKGISPKEFQERKDEVGRILHEGVEVFRAAYGKALVENREPTMGDFRDAGLNPEFCKDLTHAEYSRINKSKILPSMEDAEALQILEMLEAAEAYGFARLWKTLGAEMAARPEDRDTAQCLEFVGPKSRKLADGGWVKENTLKVHYHLSPKFKKVPTLILDGDAEEVIIRKFWPNAEFKYAKGVWEGTKVEQIWDKTGSQHSLTTYDGIQADVLRKIKELDDLYRDEILADPRKRGLIVTTKGVKEHFRSLGHVPEPGTPEYDARLHDWGHNGAMRGLDAYKNAAYILVIGRQEAPVGAVEEVARKIFHDDTVRIDFLTPNEKGDLRLPREELTVRDKTGSSYKVSVSYHPDPRCDAIHRQIREAEVYQALMRGRFLWNKGHAVIMTNIPLGIEVDRYSTWAELVPDRYDEAVGRGLLCFNLRDMAEANEDLLKNHASARKSWLARPARSNPGIVEHLIAATAKGEGVEGWKRVEFRRYGAGTDPNSRGARPRRREAWIRTEGTEEAGLTAEVQKWFPDAINVAAVAPAFEQQIIEGDNVVAMTNQMEKVQLEQTKENIKRMTKEAFFGNIPEEMRPTMYALGVGDTPF